MWYFIIKQTLKFFGYLDLNGNSTFIGQHLKYVMVFILVDKGATLFKIKVILRTLRYNVEINFYFFMKLNKKQVNKNRRKLNQYFHITVTGCVK